MSTDEFGRERVQFFEIIVKRCANEYGDAFFSPAGVCTAQLGVTGVRKCYRGAGTCQDKANLDLSEEYMLRFSRDQQDLLQYGYCIPMLESLRTAPGAINLAAMDENISALGVREVITVQLRDGLHDDHLVDHYRLERISGEAHAGSPPETYEPYTRGTFAGKFIARNPFSSNYRCQVREGYIGQTLDEMSLRKYIIDRIEGPNEGIWTVIAKDLFSKLEAQKSVAPKASRGELAANISDSDASATLSPAGIGELDYPIPDDSPPVFYVAIGDEIILTQRSGDTLNFVTRGALGTTAEAHDEEDVVQVVLAYETKLAHDIVYDLLTAYGGIETAQIDSVDWDSKAAQVTTLYTGYVAEPTPVSELVGELCQQAGFTVWHDVETDMIRLAALRAAAFDITIDDNAWAKDGSLTIKRQDDRRVTEVWTYYAQRNKKEDLEKRDNYRSRFVSVDLDAEGDNEYGIPKIREIFSRWIPQFGRQAAQQCGERILSLFRNPPLQAELSLHHSRLPQIDLGQFVGLNTADVQDETGAIATKTMAVAEIERGEHELSIMLQEVAFYTQPDDTGDREIFIENNSYNLNLRTLHDGLYGPPPEVSPPINVTFRILEGVTVGSTSTSNPAIRTGNWSDVGIVPNLSVSDGARIQGKGGAGGQGGGSQSGGTGATGGAGGVALLVEHEVIVTGSGEIWGGGGGGGGGEGHTPNGTSWWGGGGGAGAAGTDGGSGGAGGAPSFGGVAGGAGTAGTSDDPGSPGAGAVRFAGSAFAGNGGAGGGPGQAGSSGGENSPGDGINPGAGSGGSAGAAIDGVSLVTFESPNDLDIAGTQIN